MRNNEILRSEHMVRGEQPGKIVIQRSSILKVSERISNF